MNFLLYTSSFFSYFSTFFIAILPFVEAKGAIPIGMGLGLSPIYSFLCSYLGSLVPVPFLLSLFTPLLEWLNQNPKYQKWANKLNGYVHKKMKKVHHQTISQKEDKPILLGAIFLFVALPIPGTGVWSGSVVASMLKVKKTSAFFIIALANFFSSLLVFLATFGFFI